MIKFVLIGLFIFFVGMTVGGIVIRNYIFKHDANGFCFRADDGEVYLHLSEHAQQRLADPDTIMLVLRVKDATTRKKQSLS